ncbi:ABC transporter ATP-binding protein [Streptomyces candidus]|uniref:Iron complex transport system ATP-binding protein n=1 Tax=Streptomyces candidus TaxID=67283 RepID=A0A7X0HMY6_9ACTN|nr:ABC transporter ATP-binding protein [Streptomyces candidus]MBB6439339.1 iron complex transport system ATP-binding protein [Streptomyces candidus]GHH42299.1 ABC transporter ATP-binding protein [Streptomyces candidus]
MNVGEELPQAAPARGHALAATGVTVAYDGVDVVHEASLELAPGRVTVLVGPNGSGKSTLLRTVARLQRARSATLTLDGGTDGFALSPREFSRQVALLTQGRPTPSGLTVRDVVEFGRYPHRGRWGRSDPGGREAVDRALGMTGVAELAERGAEHLSGGQLQRVWLAGCLAQETGVLLLDEPTTYLDLRYQVELLDLIRDLADDHAIAVGVVLHDLDQAAAVADRIVLLRAGRVIADGEPGDVLTPERLTDTYGIRIEVSTDPLTGRLRTRAIGRHHTRRTPDGVRVLDADRDSVSAHRGAGRDEGDRAPGYGAGAGDSVRVSTSTTA